MKWISRITWHLFIGLALLGFYTAAFSEPPKTLALTTKQLIDASKSIQSGEKLSPEQLNTLRRAAETRAALLSKELNRGNNTAARYVLSPQTIQFLPKEIQKYIETEVGPLTGKLQVISTLFEKGQEQLEYVLLVGNERYTLHFTDGAPRQFKTDAKVTIYHAMKIMGADNTQQLVLSHQAIEVINPKYALPLSLGPQRTLTFLVNFSDKPTDRPWTVSEVNELMYTTINNHFLEASYQQTNLTGQTVGWYVINVNSNTPCNTLATQVVTLADQAAQSDGVDLSQYDRKVYIFPRTTVCSWAGRGVVGGSKTVSWINGAVNIRTPAHELGHNFGIYHSRLLKCTGSPNSGSCSRTEYGDGTDIMGAARTSHFNAHQKDILGWLNYQSSPPITTITTSGTYWIDAYETTNNNPKALKILKRQGTSDYYYLEARKGIGFDAELSACGTACDYTRGVVFHQGNTDELESSDLLDMSPGTSSRLVALLPGERWTDAQAPNGGVTFEIVSVDANGAVVNVTFGTTPPPPPTDTKLENGVPVINLSAARGDQSYYYIDVPAGKPSLSIRISGGTGDADLYVMHGQKPTVSAFQCRPYTPNNNEICYFNQPQAGRYYIMLRAYASYSNVTLVAAH